MTVNSNSSGDPAQREARAEGSVDKNVYWQYLTAWSPYFVVPIVMLAAATVERSLQVMVPGHKEGVSPYAV